MPEAFTIQPTRTEIPVVWVKRDQLLEVMMFLRKQPKPYVIPFTDRIEYLGGCVNEMPYVLAVEKLAGIGAPARVDTIRMMLSELFRINSHLLCTSAPSFRTSVP